MAVINFDIPDALVPRIKEVYKSEIGQTATNAQLIQAVIADFKVLLKNKVLSFERTAAVNAAETSITELTL